MIRLHSILYPCVPKLWPILHKTSKQQCTVLYVHTRSSVITDKHTNNMSKYRYPLFLDYQWSFIIGYFLLCAGLFGCFFNLWLFAVTAYNKSPFYSTNHIVTPRHPCTNNFNTQCGTFKTPWSQWLSNLDSLPLIVVVNRGRQPVCVIPGLRVLISVHSHLEQSESLHFTFLNCSKG